MAGMAPEQERVRRLPLQEADILQDLSCGAMYWHGRDRKCRPCLVVRIERFADLIKDKERCVRMTIFVLEYAIRYAMVPGRVENWVVLVDFENASDVVSFFQLPTMCLTAKALSQTLESVYCCRMVWVKLLNLPTILRSIVQSVIPAEKKKKVCAIEDPSKELLKYFEPNQLEARYGGTRPDLKPHETYPFHFFPGCTGSPTTSGSRRIMTCESDRSTASTESGQSTAASSEEVACLANLEPATSLHHLAGRTFHEGQLWDTSVRDRWSADAKKSSLTRQAAQVLSAMLEQEVPPCCTMQQWKELAACEGTKKQEAPAVLLGSQAIARSKEPAETAIPKERRQLSHRSMRIDDGHYAREAGTYFAVNVIWEPQLICQRPSPKRPCGPVADDSLHCSPLVACLQCSLQKGRLDTVAPIGRPVETDCWKKLLEAWLLSLLSSFCTARARRGTSPQTCG
eukprot:s8085_g4.t1